MIKKISILTVFVFLIFMDNLCAKQPEWINEIPQSVYFSYYSGTGSSNNLETAKKKAVSNAIFEIIRSGKISLIGEQQVKSKDIEENGELDYRTEIVQDVLIKGESQNIRGLKTVGEHWGEENSNYNYWILIRVPKKNSYVEMPIYKNNNFSPIWRSTIFPGWGQFYKKQPVKGTLIMSSELALVSSFIYFSYRGKDFSDKEKNEIFDMNKRETYKDNKDLAYNIATVSLIGATVVYAFNIYDSFTSKGEPIFTYQKNKKFELICSLDKTINIRYNF